MAFELTHNSYGKSGVRLTKVVRNGPRHDVLEIDADIHLQGDFEAAYASGDNRLVVATDTIKNTVYVLAKENAFDSVETFAVILARHFVNTYPHISSADVSLSQSLWQRIDVNGQSHDHAFTSAGSHKRIARARAAKDTLTLTGGIMNLAVMKTTASGWADFHADRYRTLKDAHDRILATTVDAEWTYANLDVDFRAAGERILTAMLKAFATEHSPGAQYTLNDMGRAALAVCDDIRKIAITLPNQHRIPFNLEPFGLKFENDIFVTTSEPYGLIKGTVERDAS